MTEIYLYIVARMADYMATHPYNCRIGHIQDGLFVELLCHDPTPAIPDTILRVRVQLIGHARNNM